MSASISVVIPTYNRGNVLLDTIGFLTDQLLPADEIVVVDQTAYADSDPVAQQLGQLHQDEVINWLQRTEPSIPKAMNYGLLKASSEWVLFLDDDVDFQPDFIRQHKQAIEASGVLAHVGQIIQPWQQPEQRPKDYRPGVGLYRDLEFPFHSTEAAYINNCMAGNLCVNRRAVLQMGGFDEHFYGAAYRFETEFCKRFCKHFKQDFFFAPLATLNHLHIKSGGTRAYPSFLTGTSPVHSMGDYYLALLHGSGLQRYTHMARRYCTSIVAKFYLAKPWYIPLRLVAEARGFWSALRNFRAGPELIECGGEEVSNE